MDYTLLVKTDETDRIKNDAQVQALQLEGIQDSESALAQIFAQTSLFMQIFAQIILLLGLSILMIAMRAYAKKIAPEVQTLYVLGTSYQTIVLSILLMLLLIACIAVGLSYGIIYIAFTWL